jgi:hypothetical protein
VSKEEKTALRHQIDLVVTALKPTVADMSSEHARKLIRKAMARLKIA